MNDKKRFEKGDSGDRHTFGEDTDEERTKERKRAEGLRNIVESKRESKLNRMKRFGLASPPG